MKQAIFGIIGFALYEILNKWAQRPVDPSSKNVHFLPTELKKKFVPPYVKETFHNLRLAKHFLLPSITALSRWRFIHAVAFDSILVHLHALDKNYEIIMRSQNSRDGKASGIIQKDGNKDASILMSSTCYDDFKRSYDICCQNVTLFQQKVIDNHNIYCQKQFIEVVESKEDTQQQTKQHQILKSRTILMQDMQNHIKTIVWWLHKMKLNVDNLFLTAKFRCLYS